MSNPFIGDVCRAWSDFNDRPIDENMFSNQNVFNHSHIDGHIIYADVLKRSKAFLVSDFFVADGIHLSQSMKLFL